MKGDMYLAQSSDDEILKKSEHGGAVTSLLKFALESKMVDAVLAVKARDGNRYDGVPMLITDPEAVIETAGSLHCVSPNIARFLKEYLDGAFNMKIAVVCKPCDARAIIELAKRAQINMDSLILIGLNCTGTLPSATAKQMFHEEFGVNPADIIREDLEEGKLNITLKDGTEKAKNLDELEQKGYGRRENCRRCDINIPVMADIACGKWGTDGKKATFIEVCSEKGYDFIEKAIEAGYIKVEKPDSGAIESRKKRNEEEVLLARKWQEKDIASLRDMSTEEKFSYWLGEFSRCIKCYGCRDACPICYCKDCILEADRGIVAPGEIPPDIIFPMIRSVHVMDSCVNCGQCEDACSMDLPLARLVFMLNRELGDIFKNEPGMDVNAPIPLKSVTDEELTVAGVELQF
ncbi:MAG: Coenzyme F420 hydrogenase/dehydrogenase, beta subunit C-terminal domain [Chloroflexota bacterium]|nr:Coenzyme F420 hydrogenase/dehydrogenase, beta subunit C-terminal domain [Chloroflexota bacterium]